MNRWVSDHAVHANTGIAYVVVPPADPVYDGGAYYQLPGTFR